MIFNSPAFLLLFLPLAAALFFGLPRWRLPIAVVLSLAFYETSAGLRQVAWLALCIGWVHLLSAAPGAIGSRVRLALAVAMPLLLLAFYKYADFLLSLVPGLGETNLSPKGALPAGLSFYAFHLMSFAIDRYRGAIPAPPGLLNFACYVAFFPQLVAGPITRFSQVGEAIANLPAFRLDRRRLGDGIGAMVVGLACKVLLADPLARALAPLWAASDHLPAAAAAYLVAGYSFQIYFDFYGYSMMAIGLGELFGVSLPANFLRPYLSCDPRDFWRRWHVSLSSWIRDYLYLPLGGNRAYARNILIVFAVCGLWHGAGWNFIAWGLYHGVLVLAYGALRRPWDALPRPLAVAATFALVSLGWPLFVLDLPAFLRMLAGVAGSGAGPAVAAGQWGLLGLAALMVFAVDTDALARPRPRTAWPEVLRGIGLAVTALACLGFVEGSEPFIYFRF